MAQVRLTKEAESLSSILSGTTNDVIITIRDLVLIRNKTRDEMGGAIVYHYDDKSLESIDGDDYSFDDVYDMHKWNNKRELTVWRDLREE